MLSVRRRGWIVGALSLAALPLHAIPGSAAGCGVGPGWDLFRTGTGTYYNPVADVLGDALSTPLTRVSFKGIPVGHHLFSGVGDLPTGPTDTIVQKSAFVPAPGGPIGIELVALQLQANGLPALGLSANAPVFVTLQSQRGAGLLDPAPGPASSGVLNVVFTTCGGGNIHADFTVNFDVRLLGVDGPILLSRSLSLHSDATWGSTPPPGEIENCHPHTIATGVHCTLGPPVLIERVNHNVVGGDFYLGADPTL